MISDQLRTKQGPLARVWLASHWERKISKSQFLQTNLEKTIDAITTNQQEEPIALRVSGQLLLGVVRIYSRKTKYLLEDCNEALIKIKLAFKKGDVNMPDIHQTVANMNTITLQDKLTEFDILLPDLPFNASSNMNERDPILDSLGDMSMSQDITLSDMQNGFAFGNWETGRGLGGAQDGIEVGRRDNEAGFADNSFDMDAIADPLKDMNINDNNNGLGDDAVQFDFDLNDNIDYGDDEITFDPNNTFNMSNDNNADASLDTLMVDGIVAVGDDDVYSISNEPVAELTVRRRKRLVVDQITEIPQADLRRYNGDVSTIVNREPNTTDAPKNKTAINLTKPSGESLGSELESLFNRLSNKRRAPVIMSEVQKQARLDDPLNAPTPAADGTSAFHFDDYGDFGDAGGFDDDGGFNEDAHAQFGMGDVNVEETETETETDEYDMLMNQNTQSFNTGTRKTLETLDNQFATRNVVKFGELATSSTKKADAAKLFYDILLLSTKNKIKVKQVRPFSEIQISAPTALAH